MGPSKKSQKVARAPIARNTRNRTRLHKPKLVTDPAQSTLQLTNQLRALGLYAAPTLGDGNCLFRALADQLWGSPHDHLKLRVEVCDWMEARKERYEGFVDEDRSFDTHIKCMRIPGTYGGHLELSAFAHLKRRNVKVIQPGLVYVIEWSCGWGADPTPPPSQPSVSSIIEEEPEDETGLNERDRRRLRRDKLKQDKERVAAELAAKRQEEEAEEAERSRAVYVAYHDWEHFSSVRNLSGPHAGLPDVLEKPERSGRSHDDSPPPPPPPPAPKSKPKSKAPATPRSKAKGKAPVAPSQSTPAPSQSTPAPTVPPPSDSDEAVPPTQIPLPPSRSASPSAASSSLSQPSASTSASSALSSLAPLTPPDMSSLLHNGRSPKRTFDESEDAAPRTSPSRNAKRRKAPSPTREMDVDVDVELELDADADENTPSLSEESSLSDLASPASSSALSSPSPPTPPAEPEPEPPQRRLTRRQRKELGLPKPRPCPVPVSVGKTRSAGKIVIPGGKHSLRSSMKGKEDDVPGEWRTNGTGRLDVRGFRELRI